MPLERERKLGIVPGTKRSGKTFTTLEKIDLSVYPPHVDGAAPVPGQKWLIFDINKEYGNASIAEHNANRLKAGLYPLKIQTKVISIDKLLEYSNQQIPEVCRILPLDENGNEITGNGLFKMMTRILQEYRHGGLLLEDYNGVSVGKQTLELVSTLTRTTHFDLDIIIHMQSLAKVETSMWQNADLIRWHKCMDEIDRIENRVPAAQKYFIAEQLINLMYRTNPRFYCYIDNKLHKIWGKFSLNDYQVACLSYLYNNPEKIKNEITRSAFAGGGEIDKPTALKRALEKLMIYYGNPIYT